MIHIKNIQSETDSKMKNCDIWDIMLFFLE